MMASLRATAIRALKNPCFFVIFMPHAFRDAPFLGAGQKHCRRLDQMSASHDVATFGNTGFYIGLAGLILLGRQAEVSANILRIFKALWDSQWR
jgi:hypothetical protein